MSGAERRGLLVLTAIPEERAAIARALSVARLAARVVVTGDGGTRAARGAAEAIRDVRPAFVVGAGVAGGLSRDLAAGDLVVSARVLDAADEAPAPDPSLVERARSATAARPVTILSVVRPALTAAQKAALAARTGDPAVVDMESAAWARACAAAGVPYVILRAVSDTADEDLPGYLAACMDAEGSIRRGAVARRALLSPGSIPALLRMRRRVAGCGRALGDAVAALASALPVP